MDAPKTQAKPFIVMDKIMLGTEDRILFDHLRWEINSGQQWAILGPNGSGKSLLSKAICRKVSLLSGEIHYYFENDQGYPFFKRDEIIIISPDAQKDWLKQYGGYYQSRWMSFEGDDIPTVNELLSGKNIEHLSPFEVTPLKVDEQVYFERRQYALTLLGIEYLLERKIHQLSNGETRKVMIARALMQSPKLLILDDPFYGLDQNSRAVLSQAISSLLSSNHLQILFITSRPEEIPAGITHILQIDKNQAIFMGTSEMIRSTLSTLNYNQIQTESIRPRFARIADWFWPTTKEPYLIEMEKVNLAYQGVEILKDITWKVRPGEHWALLGANGAGKSSLLSMILGDNPQSYGQSIRLFGKERGSGESIWDIKQQIGWVAPELQNYFDTQLTCLDVVCSGFFDTIGLYENSSPEQVAEATIWMDDLGIGALVNRSFNTVSVGEQRLVLIARALVKRPLLLILDEPCQGLDSIHRKHILELIHELSLKTPVSLIMVTHHREELTDSIDYVLKLDKGAMISCGPCEYLG